MTVKTVNVATLKNWLQQKNVVLLDVREVEEYKAENIAGAILIPLAQIPFYELPELGEKKLVIHCRSGKRSLTACHLLLENNPNLEVYNLEGGILAWLELSTTKPA
jgi:rhodanese-related sulfurtransferase